MPAGGETGDRSQVRTNGFSFLLSSLGLRELWLITNYNMNDR